jgi:uncharacterized protein YoxC
MIIKLIELLEGKRIPRKKGQKRKSKKHSDLYTDEDPKGTIHGLKFATVKDAEASVNKIKSSGRTHAHKVQAAVAMEQRAKAAGKKSAAAVYRKYINSVKKSEGLIKENIAQNLIDAWKKETSSSELKIFCKRDGCGPAALDLMSFAKERGIELKRIEGFFHADKVASEKNDFTPEMKDEFLDQGGDFNDAEEREEWVENSKYSDQWKFIPHYWLEDDKGTIYDPVGQEQFIDMGLAKDLNKERYTLTDEVNENVAPDHDGKAAPYGSGYEPMDEKKWSDKYKRSIDCDNPKGFSQKAHCQSKKKRRTEVIRKVDNDWVVYPKKGGKRLGTHKTKKAALKQLAAIEINKAKSEGIQEDSTRTTKKGGKGTLKRKMTRAGYGGKITISKLQKFKNRKGATAHDKAQANMVINFMRANRKK